MVQTRLQLFPTALLLAAVTLLASAHSDHGNGSEKQHLGGSEISYLSSALDTENSTISSGYKESYFSYPDHGGLMMAHIVAMIVAWCFILPIGITLSVARSCLAPIVQISFLGFHGIGMLVGIIYSRRTPDLYTHNMHNTFGWIVTWIALVHCSIGLLRLARNIGKLEQSTREERTALSPVSIEALEQHQFPQVVQFPVLYRYSHDSGHYTASDASRSHSISSTQDLEDERQRKINEYEDAHPEAEPEYSEKHGLLGNFKVERFTCRIAAKISNRSMILVDTVYNVVNSIYLLLGFIAILSGAVVYGGVFRGNNIFNGLAHSVKGGIFFWYGLLTLGRWMGCFAEIGWAWNVRPPVDVAGHRKAAIPSAEFVESSVIFIYGASNIWLEHLAAWGGAWSAQDFEHVSISIMFFGGGLCGMLVESRLIRDLLNTSILSSTATLGSQPDSDVLRPPRTYGFSMNPIPGLIIMLLGLMMSSHDQSSMVSTMIHRQWGTLFVGFALARAITYMLIYLSPPASYLPSRPPSELISAFCLISGGIIFVASNKDTVAAMEYYDLHAMFPFTVTMGVTAFIMAWAITVLAVKGWAQRKSQSTLHMINTNND